MRKIIVMTALSAFLAGPMIAAPTEASASCKSRKTTGTILGGVGGALLGNAIADGGTGAVVGGVGGALVGRQIGKSGCNKRQAYRTSNARYVAQPQAARAPVRKVYYDQYGNAISSQPVYR